MWTAKFISRITRQKSDDSSPEDGSGQLRRCLTLFDLTALGIGSLMDAGLYVVIGQMAHDKAGPAVILSFLIASVASFFVGLCYAEFASHVTKAGSAYVYTYAVLGEIWAFLTGWCMIAECVLNASSLASACSEYVNFLFHGEVYRFFKVEFWTWYGTPFAQSPDFVAFALVLLMSLVVSLGVQQSKILMDAIVLLNTAVVLFVIFAGSTRADVSNWSTEEKFAPYGGAGILTASATCFYCFIGFDIIPNASEEALRPKRSIPAAILLSLVISFFAYVAVSVVLTLMVPYSELKDYAPLAEAFASRGSTFGKYAVSVGALCSMLSSLLAACFSTPRLIYSIASDGLICRALHRVHPKRRVPLNAIALSAATASALALLLEIQELVDMVVLFTMFSYMTVALSVLLNRYRPDVKSDDRPQSADWLRKLHHEFSGPARPDSSPTRVAPSPTRTFPSPTRTSPSPAEAPHPSCPPQPSQRTSFIVSVITTILVLCMLGFCVCFRTWLKSDERPDALLIALAGLFGLLVVVCTLMLMFQPQNSVKFSFMVPCVPLLPVVSIAINMFMLVMLSEPTFLRCAIWIIVGEYLQTFINPVTPKFKKYVPPTSLKQNVYMT